MPTRKRNKPLFRKKAQASPAMKTILLIILVVVLVAVGFMLGEPLLKLLGEEQPAVTDSYNDDNEVSEVSEVEVTTTPVTTEPEMTEATAPPEPELPQNGIIKVNLAGSDNYSIALDEAIEYAKANGYHSVLVELISDGGLICYKTSNKLANDAGAVSANALPLDEVYSKINDAGLLAYAEISALTDHYASWLDRNICYLFADGSSKWLDNSASKGGKPWISAFSESAREYISSFVIEISDCGFAGIIASDLIFPPFRSTDLNYIGDSVKAEDRYIALAEFAGAMHESLGAAKSFAIAVDAKDIISGEAELLKDTDLLTTKSLYVIYNSEDIGDKLVRRDGTAVSFAGLSEYHKVKTVFKLVSEALGDDIIILPAFESGDQESFLKAITESGYEASELLISR